jgi:hypothetical protein
VPRGGLRQRERRRAVPALFQSRWDGRNYRQQHGSLSICRLASDRLPEHPPPFSSGRRSVSLGGRAVDHMNVAVAGSDQGFKQSPPYSPCRPAMKPVVDGCGRPVARGTVLPPATRFQDMDDAADHSAIVGAMRAGLIGRKKRRDHRPLLIIKPELSCHHQTPSVESLNHIHNL